MGKAIEITVAGNLRALPERQCLRSRIVEGADSNYGEVPQGKSVNSGLAENAQGLDLVHDPPRSLDVIRMASSSEPVSGR